MDEKQLTAREVADLLEVTERTVLNMTEELRGYKTGRTGRFWKFPESAVMAYLEQRKQREQPPSES